MGNRRQNEGTEFRAVIKRIFAQCQIAKRMAAFYKHGASEFVEDPFCRVAQTRSIGDGGIGKQFRLWDVWRDEIGKRQKFAFDYGDCIWFEKSSTL